MEFGERLKCLREENKLSREELSEKLKISYSSVSKYETNIRFPDKETLKKIADFFSVSVDYLLGRSNIRTSPELKIVTKAYHNIDTSGLPDEDVKKVEEYVELLKKKYNPNGNLKKI